VTGMSVQFGGGFHPEPPPWMSEGTARRLAAAEYEYQRAGLAEQRERDMLAEDLRSRAALMAARHAEARGEYVHPLDVVRGQAGRTRAEAIAYMSAQADLDDARERVRLRKMGWSEAELDGADQSPEPPEPQPATAAPARATQARARAAAAERQERQREIAHVAVGLDRINRPVTDAERSRAAAYRATWREM
jgi:hypothetical protein